MPGLTDGERKPSTPITQRHPTTRAGSLDRHSLSRSAPFIELVWKPIGSRHSDLHRNRRLLLLHHGGSSRRGMQRTTPKKKRSAKTPSRHQDWIDFWTMGGLPVPLICHQRGSLGQGIRSLPAFKLAPVFAGLVPVLSILRSDFVVLPWDGTNLCRERLIEVLSSDT